MGAALLITLREGLEIALVVAIVLAYLRNTNRGELFRPVWHGTWAATGTCVVAGVAFYNLVGDFEGRTEQLVEGVLALAAAVVLTWMIFWMRQHARGLSSDFHDKVDVAASRSSRAVGVVAFVAVAREGFETVLFLVGARVNDASGAQIVIGGLVGLAIAAFLGYLVYEGGHRINIQRFFLITGGLLIVFAAGLFAKSLHEFRELFDIGGWLARPVWEVTSGPLANGWLSDFLAGLFGWAPNAEVVRVIAYFTYLVPIAYLYFADTKPRAVESTQAPRAPIAS